MGHVTVPGNFSSSLTSTRFTIPQAAHTIHKAVDLLKVWWAFQRNWWKSLSKMENHGIMDYSSTKWHPFPAPFHHHWKPSQAWVRGLHFPRSLPALGSLWRVPGFTRNSSNINLVLPPATTWNSNQDSLFSWRKCMETSGRLESLTSQPRSLIPTGSSFQTFPSWEEPTRWSNPDHYLLISSWKLRARSGTTHNLLLQVCQGISKQSSQTLSNQPYQQAIWLHQHCMKKECHPWGRTLLPIPQVPLVYHLPFHWGDQLILQRVFPQGDSPHPGLKTIWNSVEHSRRSFMFRTVISSGYFISVN